MAHAATAALGGDRATEIGDICSDPDRPAFHPHRMFPRYAHAFRRLSRIPGALTHASGVLGPLVFDPLHSDTENASCEDLRAARYVVVGFPRTGTTFLQGAIATAFGDHAACWKNHDPLAVPLYSRLSIPTLVTMRDPIDTVLSWSLYHQDRPSVDMLNRRLAVYTAWHREVRRHMGNDGVHTVQFNDFTQDPVGHLADVVGLATEVPVTATTVHAHVDGDNRRSGRILTQANTPDSRRNVMKAPYAELLRHRSVRRHLRLAYRAVEGLLN